MRRLVGWAQCWRLLSRERDAVSKLWWSPRGGLRLLRCAGPRRGFCRGKVWWRSGGEGASADSMLLLQGEVDVWGVLSRG